MSDQDKAEASVYDAYSADVQVVFKGAAGERVPSEVASRVNEALRAFEDALGETGGACRAILTVDVAQALNLERRG